MESLVNLKLNRWESVNSPFLFLPKFKFMNSTLPIGKKTWRRSNTYFESRITQKRFKELFECYHTINQITIKDSDSLVTFYVGCGFVFRDPQELPIIVVSNDGNFVSNNLTLFEQKLLKKLGIEYEVRDFILDGLIVHHKYKFKTIKEKNEYLDEVMRQFKVYNNI